MDTAERPDFNAPFVLLDDARGGNPATARLYSQPKTILRADHIDSIARLLGNVEVHRMQGQHVAGYLAYEAGYAFEPKLKSLFTTRKRNATAPLGWFGVFDRYTQMAGDKVEGFLSAAIARRAGSPPILGPLVPDTNHAAYLQKFAQIKQAITDGDVYQANLTFGLSASFSGDPMALYLALRQQSRMGYGALVFDGKNWLLSLSPELFFTLKDGVISARPMKGTAPRSFDSGQDKRLAEQLQNSVKDRAENLMIVDLLRNDLSRIAKTGSVKVPKLFAVESYPTVHQMTSSVTAELAENISAGNIIQALFPCGSITGAPKIRAMELLHDIEDASRNVYCGAIGRFDPVGNGKTGDAAFNVAIRTLQFAAQSRTVRLGLGSGIVADSSGPDEWRECLLKGGFVEQVTRRFDLLETMAFDPERGILRLELHLERLKSSAKELGFEFDRHAARNALNAACFTLDRPSKVRLLLSPTGATAIEMRDAPAVSSQALKIVTRPLPVDAGDFRLRHKTTDRAFYDDARAKAADETGADEVIFVNTDGALTEGSFTNVFVKSGDIMHTPPAEIGLLPGVLRAEMLANGTAIEAPLTVQDLKRDVYIGNALRGLLPAKLI